MSVAEMIRLRRAGYTVAHVAGRAGYARSTVGAWFRSWGVYPDEPVDRSRTPDARVREVERLYWEEGRSQAEVGARVGMHPANVARLMRVYGIRRRTQSEAHALRRALYPDLPNPPRPTPEHARRAGLARVEAARRAGKLGEQMSELGRASARARRERERTAV